MYSEVRDFVEGCEVCTRNKEGLHLNMKEITADEPFNIIGIDLVGPLKSSHYHQWTHILIVVDYFSKWVELFGLESARAVEI